ncbi:MAG: alpha/beta fold hydrolase [Pseudomonadota bacterium]
MSVAFADGFAPLSLGDGAAAPHVDAAPSGAGAEAMLLIHGFMMSRAIWTDNLGALSAGRRRLVSLELLGHGRSPAPSDDAAYRAERYIEWFETTRQRLGIARWVVCGHSLGAALALNYALAHPDAVSAVIATNSLSAFGSVAESPAADQIDGLAASLKTRGAAALADLPFHPKHIRNVSAATRDALLRDSARLDPDAIEQAMRVTAPALGVPSRLAALRPPALLVNGLRERAFQPARARAERLSPQLEIVDIACGHSVNAEAPGAFHAAVDAFLERHLETTP